MPSSLNPQPGLPYLTRKGGSGECSGAGQAAVRLFGSSSPLRISVHDKHMVPTFHWVLPNAWMRHDPEQGHPESNLVETGAPN
jgi:hypothetical protein